MVEKIEPPPHVITREVSSQDKVLYSCKTKTYSEQQYIISPPVESSGVSPVVLNQGAESADVKYPSNSK